MRRLILPCLILQAIWGLLHKRAFWALFVLEELSDWGCELPHAFSRGLVSPSAERVPNACHSTLIHGRKKMRHLLPWRCDWRYSQIDKTVFGFTVRVRSRNFLLEGSYSEFTLNREGYVSSEETSRLPPTACQGCCQTHLALADSQWPPVHTLGLFSGCLRVWWGLREGLAMNIAENLTNSSLNNSEFIFIK